MREMLLQCIVLMMVERDVYCVRSLMECLSFFVDIYSLCITPLWYFVLMKTRILFFLQVLKNTHHVSVSPAMPFTLHLLLLFSFLFYKDFCEIYDLMLLVAVSGHHHRW